MDTRLVTCFVLLVLWKCGQSCYITKFQDINVMERFIQSEYIVYGRTLSHEEKMLSFRGRQAILKDATFEVYCILKGNNDIDESIIISGISPRYPCSGTDVSTMMAVNATVIVGIKKKSASRYELDEVMPTLTAAIDPYKLYFSAISNICGLQDWRAPVGTSISRCPICGVSNYSADIQSHPVSGSLKTCVFNTTQTILDMTACDYYLPNTVSTVESQFCIPASFNNTCVTLAYRNASTANCDCNRNSDGSIFTDGSEQTVANSLLMCVSLFMWTIFLVQPI